MIKKIRHAYSTGEDEYSFFYQLSSLSRYAVVNDGGMTLWERKFDNSFKEGTVGAEKPNFLPVWDIIVQE